MLFGDEDGTERIADELGLRYVADVERNENGTPRVDSLFEKASRIAQGSILCYVNADIILMSDFAEACKKVRELDSFLMVGRRTDLEVSKPLVFSSPAWEEDLRRRVCEEGRLRPANWIDYFVFRRGLYGDTIPPFAVGRTAWDNWLIWHARRSRAAVVDATSAVVAVHQNHTYRSGVLAYKAEGIWEGPEVPLNRQIAGKRAINYNIDDATLVFTEGRLSRQSTGVRARRFVVTHFPGAARAAVAVSRRIGIVKAEE